MRFSGLRAGPDRLDLLVEETGGRRRVTVTPTTTGTLTIYVDVPLGPVVVRAVTVNGEPRPDTAWWTWSPFGETRVQLGYSVVTAARPLVIEVEHEPVVR